MKKEVKPLSPAQIYAKRSKEFLPEVIQAVNELLTKEFDGKNSVTLLQKDIVARTLTLCETNNTSMTSEKLFKEKHMDFESHFVKAGWNVYYDKPAYSENYEATFKFTPKKKRS